MYDHNEGHNFSLLVTIDILLQQNHRPYSVDESNTLQLHCCIVSLAVERYLE